VEVLHILPCFFFSPALVRHGFILTLTMVTRAALCQSTRKLAKVATGRHGTVLGWARPCLTWPSSLPLPLPLVHPHSPWTLTSTSTSHCNQPTNQPTHIHNNIDALDDKTHPNLHSLQHHWPHCLGLSCPACHSHSPHSQSSLALPRLSLFSTATIYPILPSLIPSSLLPSLRFLLSHVHAQTGHPSTSTL